MLNCPACAKVVPEESLFCSSCGTSLGSIHDEETRIGQPGTSGGEERASDSQGARLSSSGIHGQFIPGAVVAERYRIVGLLGRGGMGEVYRADDLKLGQAVALKFLPRALAENPDLLARFFNEVRVARQVSHSNVCRVYDVAEFGGQPLLSMEYVDGENLATLLKRIGRLPEDKALQVARQLCAGLAAAHQQGVIHRDLKPANIMLDGQGRVRITDFGLAGLAGEIEDSDIRVGTPAYMAPEQLAGQDVTFKSDIYSLGLVLYELFTGKRAFEASGLAELNRLREQSPPPSPSSHLLSLDPAVERVILRSLDPNPVNRPNSTLAISAALPGGDPLAAALEAGETPSPEMVADAGEYRGLQPAIATVFLLLSLLALLGVVLLSGRTQLLPRSGVDRPPSVLTAEASRIATALGQKPPFHQVFGFDYDVEILALLVQRGQTPPDWDAIIKRRPGPIQFWYRQSSQHLVPSKLAGWVTYRDPPLLRTGMVNVLLDPQGRLLEYLAVPPPFDESGEEASEPDWNPLFHLAEIDPSRFQPVSPLWNPPFDCDRRAAWEGTLPEQENILIRLEAGAYRGQIVFFKVVPPWRNPEGTRPELSISIRWALAIVGALLALIVVGAILLTWRNLRMGRGDRRGARRLGLCGFLTALLFWGLRVNHTLTGSELGMLIWGLQTALLIGLVAWVLYVSIEPYVRRLWPQVLISWSRLLSGRFRDPLVGRDLLLGAMAGLFIVLLVLLVRVLPARFGYPESAPIPGSLEALAGIREAFASLLLSEATAVIYPMGLLLLVLLARVVVRSQWLAVGTIYLIMNLVAFLENTGLFDRLAAPLIWAIVFFVLIRFGLVAGIAMFFFSNFAFWIPLTLDLSTWYAGRSILFLVLPMALLVYAYILSLAGRPLFQDLIPD